MKKYIKPQVKVRCIDMESLMAAVSGDEKELMSVDPDKTISSDNEFGAKHSIWDNEE